MSKPRNNRANEGTPGVGSYLLPMLFSAAVGAAVTWLIMSQRSTSVVRPPSFAPSQVAPNQTATNSSSLPSADAAVVRGNMAYDHQQWAEAIREYQDAIAKGLDNADVRTDLGNALRFSGQPEKALEQYTIAQRQNPQHENSLFNQIGLFMDVIHDPIRAIPVCEEFIRRFPNSEKISAAKEKLATLKNL
jgi:tetratricopeptide (TPR) repeat protein